MAVSSWDELFVRQFVGRDAELGVFRDALNAGAPTPRIIAVHGPGGIGKTALLRRFAAEARRSGRAVVEVDAAHIEPTREAFARAADVSGVHGPVLLVDSMDAISPLHDWLLQSFLPGLPTGSLVVTAGRRPPGLTWRMDLAWRTTLRELELSGLSPAEADRVLDDLEVDKLDRAALLAFSDGHPLALRLAAGQRAAERAATGEWRPSPRVVQDLLRWLVDEPPSAEHRRALEICAHVPDTTEDLLRAVMPEHAQETFHWLRTLPFVTLGPFGLRLITVVREVIDRDLRWRAPDAYLNMHRSVRVHLQNLVRSPSRTTSLRAASGFNYVQSWGRWVPFPRPEGHEQGVGAQESVSVAGDTREIGVLARDCLGEEAAELVDFWLRRQPDAFVYWTSRTGEMLGFQCRLRFERWDAAEVLIDPLVAAVREHTEATAGLRPGEHVQLVRFMAVRRDHAEREAVLNGMLARITRDILRAERSAWQFVNLDEALPLAGWLQFADFHYIPLMVGPAGKSAVLLGHDWRAMRVSEWSELMDQRMLYGPHTDSPASPMPVMVLSRAAFDRAVHDALRAWHEKERFVANPLLGAGLLARTPAGDREHSLRDLILRAIEAIDQDPKAKGLRAAVWSTYVVGGSTQQAVARELTVSFSTYRRQLKRGVEKVCWYLWQHELAHAVEERSAWAGGDRGRSPVRAARD